MLLYRETRPQCYSVCSFLRLAESIDTELWRRLLIESNLGLWILGLFSTFLFRKIMVNPVLYSVSNELVYLCIQQSAFFSHYKCGSKVKSVREDISYPIKYSLAPTILGPDLQTQNLFYISCGYCIIVIFVIMQTNANQLTSYILLFTLFKLLISTKQSIHHSFIAFI